MWNPHKWSRLPFLDPTKHGLSAESFLVLHGFGHVLVERYRPLLVLHMVLHRRCGWASSKIAVLSLIRDRPAIFLANT